MCMHARMRRLVWSVCSIQRTQTPQQNKEKKGDNVTYAQERHIYIRYISIVDKKKKYGLEYVRIYVRRRRPWPARGKICACAFLVYT